MKFTTDKIQEILKNFSMTLEQRDREDMKLFGWKGGQVISYRSSGDFDAESDMDETQE